MVVLSRQGIILSPPPPKNLLKLICKGGSKVVSKELI